MTEDIQEKLGRAACMIADSDWTIALTGAGISVDSGIPDFRSPGGLWSRYDIMEYGTIDAFNRDPAKVWKMLEELSGMIIDAKPNPGHTGLAELEQMGRLKAVITQNVDNLHQEGGSKEVIEFHGNGKTLVCTKCGWRTTAEEAAGLRHAEANYGLAKAGKAEKEGRQPPECENCAAILKPDVVFFGEMIPQHSLHQAFEHAEKADLILVLGTSAMVVPASHIPLITKKKGGGIIEFNLMETQLSPTADLTILGSTSKTVPELVEKVKAELNA